MTITLSTAHALLLIPFAVTVYWTGGLIATSAVTPWNTARAVARWALGVVTHALALVALCNLWRIT